MKTFALYRMLVCTVAATLGLSSAQAVILTRNTAHGSGADAYVQGSMTNSNFGSSGVITTRNTPGNAANNYKAYFRFDLSGLEVNGVGLNDLDNSQILSATFKFTTLTVQANISYEVFAIVGGLPGDLAGGWAESGINYFNAPGNQSGTTQLNYLTMAPGDENGNYMISLGTISTFSSTVGGVVSFSSAALTDLIRNDNNSLVTLALRRTDRGGIVQIASKETTSGSLIPTLEISAIPEPSTIALGIGGAILLLAGTARSRGLFRN
jgi:hypothetical protein